MICGEDVRISDKTVFRNPELVVFGNHVAVDEFSVFSTTVIAGNYIHLSPHIACIGGKDAVLILGNFITVACGCGLICKGDEMLGAGIVSTPNIPNGFRDNLKGGSIVLNDFVSLGANVIIMPGVEIAEGVVVGANSLVTKSILEPWTIWYGSPARKIKIRNKEKILEYAKVLK